MKAPAFDYVRPRTVEEAGDILAANEAARLIAGGQSLLPMLNLRLVRPDLLIDISQLEGLKRIGESDRGWWIGSAVTHAQIEDCAALRDTAPMLVEVAGGIAYRSIRNVGTVGGAMAHADPAADWPLALAALRASVHVRNRAGAVRTVPADRFVRGAFATDLLADDIIVALDVPRQFAQGAYGYFKYCRKTGEYPEASAAVAIGESLAGSNVLIGAVEGAPAPLPPVAEALWSGGPQAATDDLVTSAVATAVPELDAVEMAMHAAAVRYAIGNAYRR